MRAKSLQLCSTLSGPVGCSPPGSPSMGFSRQEYRSWLLCPLPWDPSDPGTEPMFLTSAALAGRFFSTIWEALPAPQSKSLPCLNTCLSDSLVYRAARAGSLDWVTRSALPTLGREPPAGHLLGPDSPSAGPPLSPPLAHSGWVATHSPPSLCKFRSPGYFQSYQTGGFWSALWGLQPPTPFRNQGAPTHLLRFGPRNPGPPEILPRLALEALPPPWS